MSQIERGTTNMERIGNALVELGLDPRDVVSLFMDAHHVEAVLFDRDKDGCRYIVHRRAGDQSTGEFAKRWVVLRNTDSPPDDDGKILPTLLDQQHLYLTPAARAMGGAL